MCWVTEMEAEGWKASSPLVPKRLVILENTASRTVGAATAWAVIGGGVQTRRRSVIARAWEGCYFTIRQERVAGQRRALGWLFVNSRCAVAAAARATMAQAAKMPFMVDSAKKDGGQAGVRS